MGAGRLTVGIDVGGTSSEAVLVDGAGTGLAAATGPGANLLTVGAARAVRTLLDTADAAAGHERSRVGAVGVGLAGLPPARHAEVEASLAAAFADRGYRGLVVLRSDAEVAFRAGTDAAEGVVLIAGTGAIAVRIAHGRASRSVDGHGAALGDEGSGHWIGRQALRRSLRSLDGRDPPTALVDAVCVRLGIDAVDPHAARWALIERAGPFTVAEVAGLAPIVLAAADAGDALAGGIVADAVAHLVEAVAALHAPSTQPVVLAGGLLAAATAVARGVSDALAAAGASRPLVAANPAVGAALVAASGEGGRV